MSMNIASTSNWLFKNSIICSGNDQSKNLSKFEKQLVHWNRFKNLTTQNLQKVWTICKPNRSNTMVLDHSIFQHYEKENVLKSTQGKTTNASWWSCRSNSSYNQSTIAIRHKSLHATKVDTPTWRTNMLEKLVTKKDYKKFYLPVRTHCHPTNNRWFILLPLPATPHTTSDRFKSANQISLLNQLESHFAGIVWFMFNCTSILVC